MNRTRKLFRAVLVVALLASGFDWSATAAAGATPPSATEAQKKGQRVAKRSAAPKRKGRSSRRSATTARRGAKSSLVSSKKRGRQSARSLARARARARALARLRVLRSRELALRNAAVTNINSDETKGEDLEIRRAAIEALDGRAGTVVVMDPNNGRIFTIVNQRMGIGSPVKPCSTIKMVVGLAALHEGVFDPTQEVQFSRRGSMNLTDAMARSNNPVFQVLGRLLGYDRVIYYADNYGFGQKTGVNYPGESNGFLPEPEGQETGLMSSHGENFGVTAIQLASFTAAIANGGQLYVPRTPRTPEESTNFKPLLNRRIVMAPEDRMRLMAGMIGAVNYGTGRLAYNPLGQVAGKTGTCTDRDKLGLFTSFSSVDNPRVVVTVITSGYQEAGRRAAEVAGRLYNAISPRFFQGNGDLPASSGLELQN
ncbi:MAG: penicillin-binding transpeptidase domain-containing protein [Acidobacteriota bacterium]